MSTPVSPSQSLNQSQAEAANKVVEEALGTPAIQEVITNTMAAATHDGAFDQNGFTQNLIANLEQFPAIAAQPGLSGAILSKFLEMMQRQQAAAVATPSVSALSSGAVIAGVAAPSEKDEKYKFWVSRRIQRPGTIRPGTVAGVSKLVRKNQYKDDLRELHKLGVNDFSKKLSELVDYDHAILRWGSTFARHGIDQEGGRLIVPYKITTDRIENGKVVLDKNGRAEKQRDETERHYELSWEEFGQFVAHRDHALRSVIDWLKSRRSFGSSKGNPPDHEFKLQNAIIYVNATFREWWSREKFGALDGELREGLLRASKGLDSTVNENQGAISGVLDQKAGDESYRTVMTMLGLSDTTLLAEGFTTVAAVSLLRTAVKTATGLIIGTDQNGQLGVIQEHPGGLAGTLEAWVKKTPEYPQIKDRIKGINKVLSASLAMNETFAAMPTSRHYAQAYTKGGSIMPGKHASVPLPAGERKNTFQVLNELYNPDLFPIEAAVIAKKRAAAAKKKRYTIPSLQPNQFVSTNIGSFLYLNGDLISSFTDGSPQALARYEQLKAAAASGAPAPVTLLSLVNDRINKVEAGSSHILKVLLRESRYIRNFYSSHWRKEKDRPDTVARIYNTLVELHAFPDVLVEYKLTAQDITVG